MSPKLPATVIPESSSQNPTLNRRDAEPRKIAVNYIYLSGGEFAAKLLTFASFSYLAHVLGPLDYGGVEFALALMVFFSQVSDLGLGSYGAREIARDPSRELSLLREVTMLRMILSVCSMLGLGILIIGIQKSSELKLTLAFFGFSLLGGPFLLQWFFQAHDRMHLVGIASVIRQAGFAFLVFALCRRGARLAYVGIAECFSVLSVGIFCVYLIRHEIHSARHRWENFFPRLWIHFKEACPIGLTELAWAFMFYFCTVILGFMFSDSSLGWFGVSHRTLMALHTFVWLYFFNMLPSISRFTKQPLENLLKLAEGSIQFSAWTGLFIAGLMTALAPVVLSLIYGSLFAGAARSFSILAWVIPVAMLSGHHRYILIAFGFQKELLRCTCISAASSILLGFALIPFYDAVGAAAALLIANVANFVLVYRAVRRRVTEVPVLPYITMPLLAFAAAAVAYRVAVEWSVSAAVAAAIAVYLAALLRSDGMRLISFVRSIFRNSKTGVCGFGTNNV